ncbi:hypothetical protein [Nocardia wallacei]|uniref:hypothetical protein n=1 Tax=Nocardia wallacei TaxID=480035 RepID=UPI002453D301|nr:hypothetical protein [Nocardia wallacei]
MSGRDFSELPERIRSQANISSRPGQLAALGNIADDVAALLGELEQSREASKTLGDCIRHYNDIALEATGLHHLIDENRDGDWQFIWEEVAAQGRELQRIHARHRDELEYIITARKARAEEAIQLVKQWSGHDLAERVGKALEGSND